MGVTKYYGPPGTGKTTTLLNIIEDHIDKGGQPERIAFISFSVKAANEGKNRAHAKFGLTFEEMPYFCTSHAFCKRNMGISQVVNGRDIFDFLKEYQFSLTKKYPDNARALRSVVQDPYFDIIERSKTNCRSLKEERMSLDHEQRKGVFGHILEPLSEAWEEFRLSRTPVIYSFADMIASFLEDGTAPPLDLLIVDEAQDLAEINWRLVDKLAALTEKTFIAGDDDQAIYEWNGAKPQRFVQYEGEKIVLDQSYRIPSSVHPIAQNISERILCREPKEYKPRKELGTVNKVSSVETLPLDKGEWLIMASCDYMLTDTSKGYNIRKFLIDNGYPFAHNHYRYIPARMMSAIDTWEKIKTEEIALGELDDLYFHLGKQGVKRGFISKIGKEPDQGKKIRLQEAIDNYGLKEEIVDKTWKELFDKSIDVERRSFIEKAIKKKEDLHGEPRIVISTIHQAKGGEAENVAVYLDLSKAQKRSSVLQPDGLHRQFYVAITRTIENLYFVKAQDDYYRYII
jgi:DNA helicase II / ATP-dependent DNA helicase PcrA